MQIVCDEINFIVKEFNDILAFDRTWRVAITGKVHAGKTSSLRHIAEHLRKNGLKLGGFIEEAVFEDGIRVGYRFLDINTGETCPVAQKKLSGHGYEFYENAWSWAALRLNSDVDVMIVDELGLLEAEGRGIMPFLKAALNRRPCHLLASVRLDVMDRIELGLGKFDKIVRAERIYNVAWH